MKLLEFFERDKDVSFYDEFHYIYITLKELSKIIYCHYFKKL
jgi:hypothetical protein